MNAVVTTLIDEMTSSTAAAVSVAREKLKEATVALDRARVVSEAATDALHAQEKDDDAAIAQHKDRLQRWVLHGHSGSPPALVIDVNRAQAKGTAQATTRAAAENVTHFEALEADARAVLTAAQVAQRAETARAKTAQADQIAAELIALREQEQSLVARLVVLVIEGGTLSPRATAALDNPPCRPSHESLTAGHIVTDIHTPRGGGQVVLERARRFWDEWAGQVS